MMTLVTMMNHDANHDDHDNHDDHLDHDDNLDREYHLDHDDHLYYDDHLDHLDHDDHLDTIMTSVFLRKLEVVHKRVGSCLISYNFQLACVRKLEII